MDGGRPEGLNEPDEAESLGAVLEGNELVTYNLGHLATALGRTGTATWREWIRGVNCRRLGGL